MQRKQRLTQPSLLSRAVDSVFRFVRLAEFEILFVLFFVIVYLLFKDLVNLHVSFPRIIFCVCFFRWMIERQWVG